MNQNIYLEITQKVANVKQEYGKVYCTCLR